VFDSPEKLNLVLSLLLTAVTFLLYASVGHHQFINFDDDDYIAQNIHVHAGLTWATFSWAFRSTEAANWHPLTWILHASNWQLFGANPAGHLYVNVVLHALSALVLFQLLRRATGFTWRSFMVAALFAVHPMNVESVAWAAELKNTLSTLFALLTILAYGWYLKKRSARRFLMVGFVFALSLMSKPMTVTLPFVLLLLDYWPFRRVESFFRLAAEKIPLLALSCGSAIITMIAQKGAIRAEYSLPQRLANALISYLLYLGKAIWPVHLAAMYPHAGRSLPNLEVAASAVFLLSVTVAVLMARRHRYLAVGWFWYLGTMVPVIGLIQVGKQGMADRYAYLPLIGVFVASVWWIADWAEEHALERKFQVSAGLLVLAMLSLATYFQVGYWQDSITLWSHAVAVTGDNYAAQDCLGDALVAEGQWEKAVLHFQAASVINPGDAGSQINLAVYERRHGKIAEAVVRYQNVLRWSHDPVFRLMALENLGTAYRSLGDYSRAVESYSAALQLNPRSCVGLTGLGVIAQRSGDLKRAIDLYSSALRSRPTDVGYLLLAQGLEKQGRTGEADAASAKAQQMSGDLEQAREQVNQMLTVPLAQPLGSKRQPSALGTTPTSTPL
jgi:tetratricopeptide (TPR) repeat protein